MRIGRCLEEKEYQQVEAAFRNDPQVFGCSVNVIGILDQKCSGRNQCVLLGTDSDIQNETPCYKLLKSYLEVAYQCVAGKKNCRPIYKINQ